MKHLKFTKEHFVFLYISLAISLFFTLALVSGNKSYDSFTQQTEQEDSLPESVPEIEDSARTSTDDIREIYLDVIDRFLYQNRPDFEILVEKKDNHDELVIYEINYKDETYENEFDIEVLKDILSNAHDIKTLFPSEKMSIGKYKLEKNTLLRSELITKTIGYGTSKVIFNLLPYTNECYSGGPSDEPNPKLQKECEDIINQTKISEKKYSGIWSFDLGTKKFAKISNL